ncbi:hypothetical protein SMICM304S_11120 [Streptomyces microflavus]
MRRRPPCPAPAPPPLFTVPLALAGVLAAAPAGAATPRPGPSLTCQGKGVESKAVVRAHAETVIDAPLSTVWKLQTDVERWPGWQAHVTSADRLGQGPFVRVRRSGGRPRSRPTR